MHPSWVIAGIGELLWDIFPDGKRLGGAPLNFTCHAHQLGAEGYPVSCVGRDADGAEVRAALRSLGVDPAYVADDASHPTGTVQVHLDTDGIPSYEICEDVAWDVLPMTPALQALAQRVDAVGFGSLGQRAPGSRDTIQAFLHAMRPDALKIFDVNLRQAFFSRDLLEASLVQANMVKLSDEEWSALAQVLELGSPGPALLSSLRQRYDLHLLAYTRGSRGSVLMTADETDSHDGYPVEVVDSVGAGDAFTAALCMGWLRGHPLSQINENANRVAAFVCSQPGATPVLPAALTPGDPP